MHELGAGQAGRAKQANPALRALVAEASRALASLDAARLEELALSCQALNRMQTAASPDADLRKDLARQAREAFADMAIFGRVLEATRANLSVMNRLRELRGVRLEYSGRSTFVPAAGGAQMEGGDGNH